MVKKLAVLQNKLAHAHREKDAAPKKQAGSSAHKGENVIQFDDFFKKTSKSTKKSNVAVEKAKNGSEDGAGSEGESARRGGEEAGGQEAPAEGPVKNSE